MSFLAPFKHRVRLLEARLTPMTKTIRFEDHKFRFLRSLWWNEADQGWFDAEIAPYFQVLEKGRSFRRIVDAGGSTGSFAVAAAAHFPGATIDVFEPSPRNCIVIARNAAKNAFRERVRIHPFGLWNEPASLAFRTHGAISSLKKVTMLDHSLPFDETVEVITLDSWAIRERIDALDLIKMDIEGAEIEALEGGIATLEKFRPTLLIQAYHTRNGQRTFEACANLLCKLGYTCRDTESPSGMLLGTWADRSTP